MTTIEEVRALLPVISPYQLPAETADLLFSLAKEEVVKDAPGVSGIKETEAYCYYLAYLLSAKDGEYGVSSKQVGSVSVSYSEKNPWLAQYRSCIFPFIVTDCTRLEHTDVTICNRFFPGGKC